MSHRKQLVLIGKKLGGASYRKLVKVAQQSNEMFDPYKAQYGKDAHDKRIGEITDPQMKAHMQEWIRKRYKDNPEALNKLLSGEIGIPYGDVQWVESTHQNYLRRQQKEAPSLPQQTQQPQQPAAGKPKNDIKQQVNQTYNDIKNKMNAIADQARTSGQKAANYTMIPAVLNQLLDQLPENQKQQLTSDPKYQTLMSVLGKPVQNGNEVLQGIGQFLRGVANFSASYMPSPQDKGAYEGLMGDKPGINVPLWDSNNWGKGTVNYNPKDQSTQLGLSKTFSITDRLKKIGKGLSKSSYHKLVRVAQSAQEKPLFNISKATRSSPGYWNRLGLDKYKDQIEKILQTTATPNSEEWVKAVYNYQIKSPMVTMKDGILGPETFRAMAKEHKDLFPENFKDLMGQKPTRQTMALPPSRLKSFDDLEQYAKGFVGIPYQQPGSGQPGLDCSQFISKILGSAGVISGAGSSESLYNTYKGRWKELSSPQKGAIIFYEPHNKVPSGARVPPSDQWKVGRNITHIAFALDGSQVIDSSPRKSKEGGGGVGVRPYQRSGFSYHILMPNYPFPTDENASTENKELSTATLIQNRKVRSN